MPDKKESKPKEKRPSSPVNFPPLWEISVGNLTTFTRLWSLKLNKVRLIWFAILLFVAITAIGVTIIVSTPLRVILPGYMNNDSRKVAEMLAERVDSLLAVSAYQTDYLNIMSEIINDSIVQVRNVNERNEADSIAIIPVDSLLPASEAERRFVKKYEQREKHNLSVLSPIAAEGMVFYRPLSSSVIQESAISDSRNRGVVLAAPASSSVSSVYGGSVVAIYDDPHDGTTVVVQHPRDFISIYSGLGTVFVTLGDKVSAGSRIGMLPSSRGRLRFSLWHNGTSLNPSDYIAF